ncbi:MAG: PQQ-binding-like beta-propeller repeat protein, partial [Planctomycetota bacterium]
MRTPGPIVALCLLLLAALPASAQDATRDLASREWNQARGNPYRTSVVDVEPVRETPVEAWRTKLGGRLLSEPVTWAGTVYVVAAQRRRRELIALRSATGEVLARKALSPGGRVGLAVWQGTIIVLDGKRIHGRPFLGDRFGDGWEIEGSWSGTPLVHQGRLVIPEEGQYGVRDVRTGKELARGDYAGSGILALRPGPTPEVIGVRVVLYDFCDEHSLYVFHTPVEGLDSEKPVFGGTSAWHQAVLAEAPRPGDVERTCPVGFSRWSVFVMTPLSLVGPIFTEMDDGITRIEGCGHFPGPAVIHAGHAYGFDEDEDLVKVDMFGRSEVLIQCLQMPSGARPTSPSSSRGVLYLGNWAVEICSGKVLWCVRGLAPATPAIPAGDGLLVLGTSDGELVGLVDPSAPKRGALAGAAGPRDVDGVLLKDGRQIEGAVERRPGGSLRVVPEGGNPVEVREEEVAVATAAGATLFISEQYDTYVIWRDLLNAGLIDALESVFDSYRRAGLVQEARRLLLEVRDLGIGVERYGEWDTRLTRVRERRSRQVLKNLRAREVVVREAAYRSRVVASKWCRKRGLGGAAAVLLRDADRVRPGRAEIGSLGWGLVPMSFPFRRHEELVRLWLEWVARILPAGGEFIPPWDDAWKRVQDPPWNEGTVGLRTRNLLVFSREHDPEIVGACLRHGEGTVRALDLLLCGRSSVAPQDDSGRLEVRIHRSQREFEGWGGGPLEWIAGYYSPARRVSCFFVPRRSGTATLQERRLYRVLAHELTHQYVAERWVRGGRRASGKAPGYWIVEGIAEFVEDQTVEMGRSELTLDD